MLRLRRLLASARDDPENGQHLHKLKLALEEASESVKDTATQRKLKRLVAMHGMVGDLAGLESAIDLFEVALAEN